MRFFFACILLALFLFSACNDNTVMPSDPGYAYFPLSVGATLEYQVDSIVFDDREFPNAQDTFRSFIRERISRTTTGIDGDSLFVIERSHRARVTDPWILTDIWTASIDLARAYRREGNLRFVKMAFPLNADREWAPLTFISPQTTVPVGTEFIDMYNNWNGSVEKLGEAEVIGGLSFDEVMTCIQADENNEVERRYVMEKYARQVGLVLRIDTILDSRCKRLGQPELCFGEAWVVKGEKGYIMRQEIINYN